MFRNFPVHSGIYVTLNGINRIHGLFIKSKPFGEMSSLNGIRNYCGLINLWNLFRKKIYLSLIEKGYCCSICR